MFKKHKFNEKKLLHKIGKHWCVISIAVLGMIGGTSVYQPNVNAMVVEPANNKFQVTAGSSSENTNGSTTTSSAASNQGCDMDVASSLITSDIRVTSSIVTRHDMQEDPDAASVADNSYFETKRAYKDLRPDNTNYEVSLANAATTDDINMLPRYSNDSDGSSAASDHVLLNDDSYYDNDTAQSIIDSDSDVVHSYVDQQYSLNDNNDVENEVDEDSEGIDEVNEELGTDNNGRFAVSEANSYLSDANSVVASSASVVQNSLDTDSEEIGNDQNQMGRNEQRLDSITDSLNDDEGIDITSQNTTYYSLSSTVDDAAYSMSSLYEDDSEGHDSDAVNTADSLAWDADSATDDGSAYMSELDSYTDHVNSLVDDYNNAAKSKTAKHKSRRHVRKNKARKHYNKRRTVKHKSTKHRKSVRKTRRRRKSNRRRSRHFKLPRTFSEYWNRTRSVRAKHGFRAYEIHDVVPEYKSKYIRSKWIKANRKFSVSRRGIEWMWTLGGKGLRHHGNYYWVFNGDEKYPNHFN